MYGPAGGVLKAFYTNVEAIYADPANYSLPADVEQTMRIAWRQLGTAARMAQLGQLMAQATNAPGCTEVQRHRVDLFDKAVWSYMKAGRNQATPTPDGPLPTCRTAPSRRWRGGSWTRRVGRTSWTRRRGRIR